MSGATTLRIFCLTICVATAGMLSSSAWGAPVRVEETTIVIPTYLLGPPDPNPPFELVNQRMVYPYTMLDDLTAHREPKKYDAIVLENEYLRATILPGLGGRLYSLYDKPAHREVFYCNHVIKYGLIGLRGAWISGGIEFNFPNGHTTDTVSPISSLLRKNPDGSATAFVGDVDQVSGMYWQVALTLRPGAARLEQQVTLFNSTPTEELYWYWDNAAAAASNDMHYIYPMREVNPDEPGDYWSYPIWKGKDYSQYKNIRSPTEIFGVDVHRNFYGAYYTQSDFGVVHYANYRYMNGKKIWTWGVSDKGLIWTSLLTDRDGPYNEIQAGRFATQLNRDFMQPQEVESWTEFWYPVQHLGDGFVEATRQFALNVMFEKVAEHRGTVRISVSPTVGVQNATIQVSLDGKMLQAITNLSFAPLATQSFSVPVAEMQRAKEGLVVDILDRAGRVLLHWSAGEPIDGNPDLVSKVGMLPPKETPESDMSRQDLFLRGLEEEREGETENARRLFAAALQRTPDNPDVLLQFALQDYHAADFDAASKSVEQAIAKNAADAESEYLAGLIDRAQGRYSAAKDAFWIAVLHGKLRSQSLMQLGEIAIAEQDYARAEQILRMSLQENPTDARTQSDLAAALRLEGKLAEANRTIAKMCRAMPLYPLALAEQWENAVKQGKHSTAAQAAAAQWNDAVGSREQSYLEAASWYREIHDWPAADMILQAAVQRFAENRISAMVYYYLASNARQEGLEQRALEDAAKAYAARYEMVFINRLGDTAVLQDALLADPTDAHAQYLLGNFLFQYGRYDYAEELWSEAKKSGFEYSVLDRNLALYAWKIKRNEAQAAKLYRQAIKLAPQDFRLYADLDEVYTEMGSTEARSELFASAPPGVLEHDPVQVRYILLLLQKGEPEQALALMRNHNYRPWEKGMNFHDVYAYACIQAGRKLLSAGRLDAAELNFQESYRYPRNLGFGMPDNPDDAAGLYWLGVAKMQQGDDSGATRAWRRLLEQVGGPKAVVFYQALALERLGETAMADARLTQLANIPPQNRVPDSSGAEVYYVAGLAEQHRSHGQQAETDFRKALAINPLFWPAQLEVARLSH